MDKLFQSKWSIRIISLVLAVTLYLFVNIEANTEQNESRVDPGTASEVQVLDDVPLDIKIDAEQYVVSGVPEEVSVTLEGKNSVIAPIARLMNFKVEVDLTEYGEGEHTVELQAEGLPDNVKAYIEPKELDVQIEKRAVQEFGIDIDFVNLDKIPVGYEMGEPELTPGSVTIVSSEANIEQIAMVKVFIDVRDLKESIRNRELPVAVYDAQGNDLSVRVEPETVSVSLPVERPSKTVSLDIATKGELPDNLEIENMETPDEIEIFGQKEILNEMDEISTKELDLSEIEESGTIELELDFPEGVIANEEKVELELEVTESKEFKGIPITIEGMDAANVTFRSPRSGEIDIVAIGSNKLIKDLKKEDVSASINLNGLTEGEHDTDITLQGPDNIELEPSTETVTVEIE